MKEKTKDWLVIAYQFFGSLAFILSSYGVYNLIGDKWFTIVLGVFGISFVSFLTFIMVFLNRRENE